MWVLKIGGRQLDQPAFLTGLAELVQAFPQPPVLIHGGGRGTSQLSRRLGLEPRFVDGLRVTDEATLEATICGLAGLARMQLVQSLVVGGVRAIGLTGVDGGLVRCQRLEHPRTDLGRVGVPSQVDSQALARLREAGLVVCLAPLCLGEDGLVYNVNADYVAGAVAAAVGAGTLIFVSDVPGVLVEGQSLPELDRALYQDLMERGYLGEGMLPKLKACFDALDQGVSEVLISDLEGVKGWLQGQARGTLIRHG